MSTHYYNFCFCYQSVFYQSIYNPVSVYVYLFCYLLTVVCCVYIDCYGISFVVTYITIDFQKKIQDCLWFSVCLYYLVLYPFYINLYTPNYSENISLANSWNTNICTIWYTVCYHIWQCMRFLTVFVAYSTIKTAW